MLQPDITFAQDQFYATSGLGLFHSSHVLELLLEKRHHGTASEQKVAMEELAKTLKLGQHEAVTQDDVKDMLKEFNKKLTGGT